MEVGLDELITQLEENIERNGGKLVFDESGSSALIRWLRSLAAVKRADNALIEQYRITFEELRKSVER